jgi:hypothetical protein
MLVLYPILVMRIPLPEKEEMEKKAYGKYVSGSQVTRERSAATNI